MTDPIAQLIADNLPALIHPGDGKSGPIPLPLPMFRTSAIPPGMAQEMAKEAGLPSFDIAKLTAEALSALFNTNGWAFIQQAELTQLRADATAGIERHRQPEVRCQCGTHLFTVDIDADRPIVNGPQLIKAMQQLDPDCAAQHRKADH